MQNSIRLDHPIEEPGRPSHIVAYLLLGVLLFFSTLLFLLMATTNQLKFLTIMILVLGYILWGIIHHFLEQTLTWGILLEFLAFTTFVFVIAGYLLLFF